MRHTTINLTIAIVSHNRPEMLKKCLKSVRQQSLQPHKVITIDTNCVPLSRNIAIQKCKTRYLAFVDDDCLLDMDWVKNAYASIKKTSSTFVIGQSLPSTPLNFISNLQFSNYRDWFNKLIASNDRYALNQATDTKNIIFDYDKIKNIHFDTHFTVTEDIDFGLQLKKNKLYGHHCPTMVVHHHENYSLLQLIKKNYHKGQDKKLLDSKWGKFDDYQPQLFTLDPNKISFSLGYIFKKAPLITIVNSLDKGANGYRAKKFYQHIKSNYHNVCLYNSNRDFQKQAFDPSNLFLYGPYFFLFHLFQFLKYILHFDFPTHHFYSYLKLRGAIVSRHLRQTNTTLAILQYPEDMASITKSQPYKTLYDSPTIFSQEIEKDPRYSPAISQLEKKSFLLSDFVSFHWSSYFNLLHDINIHPIKEITLNWGCDLSSQTTSFSPKPRIVYLGILNSPWVNPQLLIDLSQKFPIDVYSYQQPDPKIYPPGSINYCGYLKDLSELSKYQFGLITITQDKLRQQGFSAKHLEYLNHGLPVLCPNWRKDILLAPSTISYTPKNFLSQVHRYSKPHLWQKKHLAAINLAKKLSWKNNLTSLDEIIRRP
jgi:glycosyltransferase involved in cell wall biosynthesis